MDWKDEMTREELLAARIRQLQRRPEDVERAAERLRAARVKNKERFDRTHRLRPKKIEEGDWVPVYDSSLDNQHKATRTFARRWFGPYVVTSVNDNGTYNVAELDGTRIAVPVTGKRIKAFKKRHEDNSDLERGESDDDRDGTDGDREDTS
jgi:type II secretory pathway pseudopilin PulG